MKEQYDEMQLQWRQKIALQTLLLTLLLIFVNGVAKTFYLWAEPMTETVVLLCVPTLFFTRRTIEKDAFLNMQEKAGRAIAGFGIVCVFGVIIIIQSVLSNTFSIVENGALSVKAAFPILILTYLCILAAIGIREWKKRRENKE